MKFEKIYLSRAMTKAMSADHPIGDPTGGPAYGERNDPVSAVIAVASMAPAVSAGIAAVTVAQGLMFAGGALSLIGNATGNKDLMVLGSAVMLGGGIGGMMSDAGTGFNSTMSEAFSSNPASSAMGGATSGASGASATGAPPVTEKLAGSTSVGNQAAGTSNVLDTGVVAPSINPTGTPVASPSTFKPNYDLSGGGAATNASGLGVKASSGAPSALKLDAMGNDPGLIDRAMGFADKNPMAAMIGAQTVGGVASGVMDMASGKSGAEAEQLEADAAYRTAMTDKTNRETALSASRIAQLNANLKAQRGGQFNVNPNAVTMTPQRPGLVAGARA